MIANSFFPRMGKTNWLYSEQWAIVWAIVAGWLPTAACFWILPGYGYFIELYHILFYFSYVFVFYSILFDFILFYVVLFYFILFNFSVIANSFFPGIRETNWLYSEQWAIVWAIVAGWLPTAAFFWILPGYGYFIELYHILFYFSYVFVFYSILFDLILFYVVLFNFIFLW